jgi:hypothetical protein
MSLWSSEFLLYLDVHIFPWIWKLLCYNFINILLVYFLAPSSTPWILRFGLLIMFQRIFPTFGSTEVGTQGLAVNRQILFHLSYTSSPCPRGLKSVSHECLLCSLLLSEGYDSLPLSSVFHILSFA